MPSSKVSPAGGVAVHGSMERSLLDRICRGEAGLAWSCATWPFVIIWTGISFYLGACLHVLLMRAWYGLWGLLCGCCFQYTDGTFQGRKAMGNDDPVDWVRASDLEGVSGKEMRLFEGKIQAADLCQGAVGDCWLVSAFACAAEQPACIRHCFITKEANRRGKYLVKIFDAQKLQWVRITVDDLIPCKNGTRRPLYMKAHQNELWAMLLEKAFAKFCGSCAPTHVRWTWGTLSPAQGTSGYPLSVWAPPWPLALHLSAPARPAYPRGPRLDCRTSRRNDCH